MSDISNFVQRGSPKFHLFHTGLARSRSLFFAMTQQFTDLEDAPFVVFGTFGRRRVLCCPPFGGVCPFAPLPAGFRRLLWPPLIDHRLVTCLWTCKCNQLYGLCHKKGLFHGMQHSYATPFDMDATGVGALRYS